MHLKSGTDAYRFVFKGKENNIVVAGAENTVNAEF
jgi:hypothetical protein